VLAQSVSRGRGGLTAPILNCSGNIIAALSGEAERPDLEALRTSGVVDCCIESVAAFGAQGTESFADTHNGIAYFTLSTVSKAMTLPGVEAKIRRVADALAFCLENDVVSISEMGNSTATAAARICEPMYSITVLLCVTCF
jgi:hypothetical protein